MRGDLDHPRLSNARTSHHASAWSKIIARTIKVSMKRVSPRHGFHFDRRADPCCRCPLTSITLLRIWLILVIRVKLVPNTCDGISRDTLVLSNSGISSVVVEIVSWTHIKKR